ncbi:MAG: hypothetical protein WC506_06880 [Candidatus Micrarchaeia archaeon]
MARAKRSKATIRHSAKKRMSPGKKRASPSLKRKKATLKMSKPRAKMPKMRKAKKAAGRKALPGRAKAKTAKPAPSHGPKARENREQKNEFWKVNALITAEIEKIGAGIARREAIEITGSQRPKRPTGAAKSMVRNKVGFELKILETEIKSGRMKVPQPKEEDDLEGEEEMDA